MHVDLDNVAVPPHCQTTPLLWFWRLRHIAMRRTPKVFWSTFTVTKAPALCKGFIFNLPESYPCGYLDNFFKNIYLFNARSTYAFACSSGSAPPMSSDEPSAAITNVAGVP
jgi:hypothetical protein